MVLVIGAIVVVLTLFLNNQGPKITAEDITVKIINDPKLSLVIDGQVDQTKLSELQSMDYSSLKTSLNSGNDFCVSMQDEKGEVILLKEGPGLQGACKS